MVPPAQVRHQGPPPGCRRTLVPELADAYPYERSRVAAQAGPVSLSAVWRGMRGPILELQHVPVAPGNSGVRIKFKPRTLLEGYRPQRIIRLFSSGWKVDDLPKEERLYE